MRYVVGLMLVAFFLTGVGLFVAGVRGLLHRFAARGRLRSAEGEIIRIEKRQEITDNEMRRSAEYHYPEIKFNPEEGGETIFLSEIGAGARALRYTVGQKIAVLYDPDGKIPPMIDSWAGIWGPYLVRTIAGPAFIFAAGLIYWAFGNKIMGK
ncbi:MAG TPA: DUF3592 domain-containing protein [Phycisphaerae bacterium]|nr:DUF3592 domain-containing protein [Phycisphaerae bacterium]